MNKVGCLHRKMTATAIAEELTVAHRGGVKLDPDARETRVLAQAIRLFQATVEVETVPTPRMGTLPAR